MNETGSGNAADSDTQRIIDAVGDAPVRFWSCPNEHPREPLRVTVVWSTSGVAFCTDCGMTSLADPRRAADSTVPQQGWCDEHDSPVVHRSGHCIEGVGCGSIAPPVEDVVGEVLHQHLYGDNGTNATLRECWDAAFAVTEALRAAGHVRDAQ